MGNKKHNALSASQERSQDISRRVRLYIGASLQYGNTKVCFAITDRCVGVSTREVDTNYLDLSFGLPPTLCKPGEEHDVLNRRNLRKIYKAFEIRTTCIFHVKY